MKSCFENRKPICNEYIRDASFENLEAWKNRVRVSEKITLQSLVLSFRSVLVELNECDFSNRLSNSENCRLQA